MKCTENEDEFVYFTRGLALYFSLLALQWERKNEKEMSKQSRNVALQLIEIQYSMFRTWMQYICVVYALYHFTPNFGIDYHLIWPNHASVKTLCLGFIQEGSGHLSDWIICCDMTQFTMAKLQGIYCLQRNHDVFIHAINCNRYQITFDANYNFLRSNIFRVENCWNFNFNPNTSVNIYSMCYKQDR